jgi:uncharacterized protein (TIGR04222 family)
MNHDQADLWHRISEFQIDAGDCTFTFADRLARENGWTQVFAQRVIHEYKRFIFMAMTADHVVTPSDEVDEAWHLHLTYTRSYWDGLCRVILKKPLHHIPTRGGPDERARHIEQYNRTLTTYANLFNDAPPSDIWPPAEIRFAKSAHHVRVDRGAAWIIPKPRWPRQFIGSRPFLAGAFAMPFLFGVSNPFNLAGPQFLIFYVAICAFAILAAYVLRQYFRNDAPPSNDTPLTPYEIACLGGGVPGVLRACLATLVAENRLTLVTEENATSFRANGPPRAADHDIERIMLREASQKDPATAGELLDAARPAAQSIQSSLQARRLMESSESFAPARWAPIALLSMVFMVGAAKVLVGISRDRPVTFLVLVLIGLGLTIGFYFWRLPLRTIRGERRLAELKSQYDRLKSLDLGTTSNEPIASVPTSDMLLAAGLFGLASLHHPDVTALDKSLKPLSQSGLSSSGCGASTGCGGGGGGGDGGGGCGGGGCGGCGGGGS